MRFAIALLLFLALAHANLHHLQRGREILLRGQTVDTRSTPKFVEDTNSDEVQMFLVHLRGPIKTEIRNDLEARIRSTGGRLSHYLPHNTFIMIGTSETARVARSAPGVLWVGPYLPEYKLSGLRSISTTGTVDLRIVLHSPMKSDAMKRMARAIQIELGLHHQVEPAGARQLIARGVPGKDLERVGKALAARNEVEWLEVAVELRPHQAGPGTQLSASGLVESNTPEPASIFASFGLDGGPSPSGLLQEVVGLGDSGLDWTSCFFNDPSTPPPADTEPDLSRKVVKYITRYADNVDETGHGTGVASAIAGNTTNSNFAFFNGLAPGAKLYFTDLGLGNNPLRIPNPIDQYLDEPWSEGVRVHVNSFGSSTTTYDTLAQSVDNYVAQHLDYLLIFSAGNDGASGPSTVGSPGNAKNVLTVGASMNSLAAIFESADAELRAQISQNPSLWEQDLLAPYSSRGPTPDGRLKPDLVAPGAYVVNAVPGTCAVNVTQGTSHAAGYVGAAAAIARQYLRGGYQEAGRADPNTAIDAPSAALLKALLIASAVPLAGWPGPAGKYFAFPGASPDPDYGHGRLIMTRSLGLASTPTGPIDVGTPSLVFDVTDGITTGVTHKYCVNAQGPFVATLVWTDAPASPAAGIALVNNLDLAVMDGTTGRQYRANGLKDFDALNNVERVFVPFDPASNGSFVVYVHGQSVPMGLPPSSQQPYALVLTGPVERTAQCSPYCPAACSGAGECVDSVCQCGQNRTGLDCSISPCPNDCRALDGSQNGYCDFETATCICGPGFQGVDCREPVQPPLPSVTLVKQGISGGIVALIAVLCCIVGGLFCGVIGWLFAVLYIERKRAEYREDLFTSVRSAR